jgi:hypothetical protein
MKRGMHSGIFVLALRRPGRGLDVYL